MGPRANTMEAFYEIDTQAPTSEVVKVLGKPYAIHEKGDGSLEYEYIERIKFGARNAEERHYFITLKEGKVVSKRVKQITMPPYLLDSYEMQTSQTGMNSQE